MEALALDFLYIGRVFKRIGDDLELGGTELDVY